MPQITLRLSNNIDTTPINFRPIFTAIHEELAKVAHLDIKTCNSGIVQEAFSYIGHGDERVTKVYLEILWLENDQRSLQKKGIAENLMRMLEEKLVPQIESQGLICVPRIRIANLGHLEKDYHISQHK